MTKKATTAKPAAAKKAATPKAVKVKAPALTKTTFSLAAEAGSSVSVAGTFNAWQQVALKPAKKAGGPFSVVIPLAPGEHQYKFVINGEWITDPGCSEFATNEFGGLNSVLQVP